LISDKSSKRKALSGTGTPLTMLLPSFLSYLKHCIWSLMNSVLKKGLEVFAEVLPFLSTLYIVLPLSFFTAAIIPSEVLQLHKLPC